MGALLALAKKIFIFIKTKSSFSKIDYCICILRRNCRYFVLIPLKTNFVCFLEEEPRVFRFCTDSSTCSVFECLL